MLLSNDSYITFLNAELARRTQNNPRYSQRAFARQLGLSAGELSEVLRGKRRLSVKASFKIARALGLNSAERKHLAHLVQSEMGDGIAPDDAPDNRGQLTLDMFNVVSDWFCFALLNLMECDDFQNDENWMARRFCISVSEVRLALDRLKKVGLVETVGKKRRPTKDYVLSPEGIPSEAVRNHHRQILHKAIHSLETDSVHEREISGVGFAVNPEMMPAIKKDIANFLDELAMKFGRGKRRTEVFQCEVSLFPLTRSRR